MNVEPWQSFYEIPLVTRTYLVAVVVVTAAISLDIVSPFALYYNWKLITQGQFWRLVTNFLFFGKFGIDFLFHMYFCWRYCTLLESGSFRGSHGSFLFFILFGMVCMNVAAPLMQVHFMGSSLNFMMLYVWGRRNEHVRMNFMGLFNFTAPYLPWVLLGFSMLMGGGATADLIGIVVGHMYYFLADIYPILAEIRGWRIKQVIFTPTLLKWLCGEMSLFSTQLVDAGGAPHELPQDPHEHQD